MATSIYHGNPGSYKSSSAVWFNIIPALKAGRFVVTNVEGLLSLEEIEKVLNVKFPSSARLFRVSTLTQEGKDLLAKWFHWLPVKSLLLIDEIQNLYNVGTKSLDYLNPDIGLSTSEKIDSFSLLPSHIKNYSKSLLDSITDDGYSDDLGLSERDHNGHLIYPVNLKDALMRHRKFNWDIIGCTPDITSVHLLFRSVAEKAVSHKSFDFVSLPYFQRRPRTHEHNPLEKGVRPSKADPVFRRKIPLDVFKLYKSTQTGSNNKSGVKNNPLKSPLVIGFFVFFVLVVVLGVYFIGNAGIKTDTVKLNDNDVIEKPVQVSEKSIESSSNNGSVRSNSAADVLSSHVGNKSPFNIFNSLSSSVKSFYISSVVERHFNFRNENKRGFKLVHDTDYTYSFSGEDDNGSFSVFGDDLLAMGFNIKYVSPCRVELSNGSDSIPVFCNVSRFSTSTEKDSSSAKAILQI